MSNMNSFLRNTYHWVCVLFVEIIVTHKKVCQREYFVHDVYTVIWQFNHLDKFSKVLDELIFKLYENDEEETSSYGYYGLSLGPSRYWYSNECSPCLRTCELCWRYWRGSCQGGLGSMMGGCTYKKCIVDRRNCGLTH